MTNHVDCVAANWNWDQGVLGNNLENNPHRTLRWIARASIQTSVTCGSNGFILVVLTTLSLIKNDFKINFKLSSLQFIKKRSL